MADEIDEQPKYVDLLAQMGDLPLEIDTTTVTPDGSSLGVASSEDGISVWSMTSYTSQFRLEMPEEPFHKTTLSKYRAGTTDPIAVYDLAFSEDGTFVAAALTNYEVCIWIREGALLETIKRPAVSLVFIPRSNLLALCLTNGHIEFWEILPARLVSSCVSILEPTDPFIAFRHLSCCGITCSKDGSQLAVVLTSNSNENSKVQSRVQIWQLMQQDGHFAHVLQKTVKGPNAFFNRVHYIQGHRYLFCSKPPYAQFWGYDTATGNTIITLFYDTIWPTPRAYSVSPNGKFVAIANIDGVVAIWNLHKKQVIMQFQAHEKIKKEIDAISALVWLPDGEKIVSVGTHRSKNGSHKQSTYKGTSPSFQCTTIKIWKLSLSKDSALEG